MLSIDEKIAYVYVCLRMPLPLIICLSLSFSYACIYRCYKNPDLHLENMSAQPKKVYRWWVDDWHSFAENTTLHGLRGGCRHDVTAIFRLLWVCVMVGMAALYATLAALSISTYYRLVVLYTAL